MAFNVHGCGKVIVSPVYIVPEVGLGLSPFVVYLIVAPGVGQEIVTKTGVVAGSGRGIGENTGAATFPVTVNVAEAIGESEEGSWSATKAIALTVDEEVKLIAAVYVNPAVLEGLLPSIVYFIVAPGAVIVTEIELTPDPPLGVIVGAGTMPVMT